MAVAPLCSFSFDLGSGRKNMRFLETSLPEMLQRDRANGEGGKKYAILATK